jgi:hypothetical protein
VEEKVSSTVMDKAMKADNAKVPKHLWRDQVFELVALNHLAEESVENKEVLLDKTGAALLVYWKRKVERDFIEWFHSMKQQYDQREDIWLAGLQASVYARHSDWWEWKGGSKIFFWRLPEKYVKEAYEELPPCFVEDLLTSMGKQPAYTDENVRQKVKEKVEAVIKKGYIVWSSPTAIRSLMYMFNVPKGTTDVRMMYGGSKSGLNDASWAPWFCLPMVESMTRGLLPGYWCVNNDYGEQFLNFNLHKDLQPYCGVDLSQLLLEEVRDVMGQILGVWSRNAMGLKPSPYGSVKGVLRAKPVITGDWKIKSNPFHWEKVAMNMPGDESYNARMPWIQKLRSDGALATELRQYIDDLRTMAKNKALAWVASSRIAKTCCWLGLQDAARK